MTTADFSKCVSDLKEKAMAFGKDLITDYTMPVTVKVLMPSETGKYPCQTLFELYWREDGYDDLSYVYTSELLPDIERRCGGNLTGRAICAISVPHEEYPLVKDLEDLILEDMEYSTWKSIEFYAFEVAEHSDGCLRGTICFYQCYRQDQFIDRTPVEAYIVIFG